VLDEATSALDEVTEAAVMASLASVSQDGRTIIVIAHRPSTLASCDLLIRLENRRVVVTAVGKETVASAGR